jgi:hypothetical protein
VGITGKSSVNETGNPSRTLSHATEKTLTFIAESFSYAGCGRDFGREFFCASA